MKIISIISVTAVQTTMSLKNPAMQGLKGLCCCLKNGAMGVIHLD